MEQRVDWDRYFLNICQAVAQRASCDRGRSGAVITCENRLLCSGYVGAPAGLPHCDEVGHLLQKVEHANGEQSVHCVRTIHAEQNALMQAAAQNISVKGATLYCSMTPCRVCAMLIISSGIKRVVCWKRYQRSADALELFRATGIEITHYEDIVMEYPLPPISP